MSSSSPSVPDITHYQRLGSLQLDSLPPLSLYVHLPWCLQKCPYCDFNSHSYNHHLPEQHYITALLSDLQHALPLVWGRPIHSVFLGGGTPSLFTPDAIASLISQIRALLPLVPQCEITLEANPGTFEAARFAAFAQAGITRLSIGVQSFNNTHLHALGRVHNRAQAIAACEEAARSFATFNLDIMYALPGQTLQDLQQDIVQALAFSPPHISIYHLTIEPHTVFAKYPPAHLPDDDTAAAMLDAITAQTARAGLHRYEVSAYARPGHTCQHNLNYWQFGDYLGIGAGAHSKLSFAHRIIRQMRTRDPARYMQQATQGQAVAQEHEVSRHDLAFEYMLNALRLRDGFALADFHARTGLPVNSIAPALDTAEQRGWITRDWQHIRPTVRGFDFLSDVQALFLPDEDEHPYQPINIS